MQASRLAYAAACIRLFSRIWEELESLATAEPLRLSSLSLEILRLDLILLIDACDSRRWQLELTAYQRMSMRTVLVEVLDRLDAAVDDASRQCISEAQNCLLDAVLEHSCELDEGSRSFPFEDGLWPLRRSLDVSIGLRL